MLDGQETRMSEGDSVVARLRERIAELERQLAAGGASPVWQPAAELDPILDAIPLPIYVKDAQGAYRACNTAFETYLGLPRSQIIGKTSAEVDPDELADYMHYADMELAERCGSQTFESVLFYPDGTSHDVIVTKAAWNTPGVAACGVVGTMQDITEGKRADLLLRNGEWIQSQFLEALPVGVCVLDAQGHLFYVNRMAQRLLGADAAVGTPVEHFAALSQACLLGTDQEYPLERLPLVRALANEQTSVSDLELRRAGGRITLEVQGIPIVSANGSVLYAMASFIDITERRMVQEALRLRAEHEEIIHTQAVSLQELSTPLLTINDGVVVMPLIGAIDSLRAKQVMEALLRGVSEQQASAAILDISGVAVVDTQVADVLVHAAQATKLLGAQVIITGVRPEIAQTLVGLGVELNGITMRSTLQSGIICALELNGKHSLANTMRQRRALPGVLPRIA